MKTFEEMLRELARPDVSEFAVASDRLPCVKIAQKYEPVDPKSRSTEQILEMLVTSGGSRYVDELGGTPVAWTWRVDGLGSVGVQAVKRDGRVQARFVLVRKASKPRMTAVTTGRAKSHRPPQPPPPRSPAEDDEPPSSRQLPTEPPPRAAIAASARAGGARTIDLDVPETAPVAPAPPPAAPAVVSAPGLDSSEPFLRAAVVKPSAGKVAPSSLEGMLASAREAKASDLHLVAGRPLMLRIGGELLPTGGPIDEALADRLIEPIVPERLRGTLEAEGSVDFAVAGRSGARFRVNVARQRTGLKACFRLIPPAIPTLASLGLPAEIEKATHHHQGLVVVTGPTGHGKTTTLAAIVDIINRTTTHHIITVEDPIEYLHPRKKAMVSQREVGSNTRSFASALKGSLREDPDVIVVGELRDTETVRMALAASETGHLVLGTMNTPSAAKTIDRLVDLFPPADQAQVRMTLAGGLHLIVSQRLLPAADGSGMVAAVELLPGSIALWALIRDNKTFQIPSLQQRGKGFGILRLDESLHDLVKAGRVTREAALSVAEYPDELEAVLDGKRPAPGAIAAPNPAQPRPQPRPEGAGGLLGKAGQLFGKKGT